MVFRQEIHEGEAIPTGWGLAYWCMWKETAVIYRVPLNIMVVLWRNCCFYVRGFGSKDLRTFEYRNAVHQAYVDGYEAASRNAKILENHTRDTLC